MGWKCPPFYGKRTGVEERKISKINARIAKLTEEKAIYQERIANRPKKEEVSNG